MRIGNGFGIDRVATVSEPPGKPFVGGAPVPEQPQPSPAAEHRPKKDPCIRATVRLLIPIRKRKEALAVLGSMIEKTRHQEGCTGCRLYRDVQVEGALLFEESWCDEEALHRHLRSETFRHILLVVEMAAEAPEIRFDWVTRSAGIEIVEEVRRHRGMSGGEVTA